MNGKHESTYTHMHRDQSQVEDYREEQHDFHNPKQYNEQYHVILFVLDFQF
jgi:hypothetical protein